MIRKAALMARVSSDEQAKGYSLDVQLNSLNKYCEHNSITITKVFKEDYSAKTFNRPAFNEFITYLKKNRGTIDVLLFTSWDRFSRNTSEAYMMINELKKLGVQAQAIEQPLDMSIPENKAILAFYLALPEIDNDRRSIKVNGGIRGARKEGRISCSAPRGYSNKRDEYNKPIIVPNEQAVYIANAFKQIASGLAMPLVIKNLKENGIVLVRSQYYKLFRSPIYCGLIRVPAGENEAEYYMKGIHEPIISEELFNKALDVLNGRKTATNRQTVTSEKDELPLRGVLVCSNCNHHITGSASRSKTGKRHFYYHCNKCKKERYKADLANQAVIDILNGFKMSSDVKNLYQALVKESLGVNTTKQEKQVKTLKEQISQQETRLQNLQDMLVDKQISNADYASMRKKYEEIKGKFIQDLSYLEQADTFLLEKLNKSIQAIANLENIYQTCDTNSKIRLLSSIFPEKLSFDGFTCRTPRINEVIRQTLNIDRALNGAKKRQLTNNLELSIQVASTRIELISNV